MSVSDALEVLALWCKEHIDGGDSVLEKLIKISDMEPWMFEVGCPRGLVYAEEHIRHVVSL